MLRIAVCDDEKKFAGELETLITQEMEILGIQVETEVFFDGEPLLREMNRGARYDLIFLDIEMEQLDGISVAREIRKQNRTVLLIYISGYEQYLKELFEVEPFRFLSKPLDRAQFRRYFRDAVQRIREEDAYYQFSFNKIVRRAPFKDIIYFESRNRIIHIFMKDGTEGQFYGKLNEVEKELAERGQCFLRIHQSFLINYNYIKRIEFTNITLFVSGGKELNLKISEERQKRVRQKLCEITGGKVVTR